ITDSTERIGHCQRPPLSANGHGRDLGTKVAFIGHFIDDDHLASWDPSMGDLSAQERRSFLGRVHRILKPAVTRRARILSKTGAAVDLHFVSLVSTSRLIEDCLRKGNTRTLVKQIEEAIDQARTAGCRIAA